MFRQYSKINYPDLLSSAVVNDTNPKEMIIHVTPESPYFRRTKKNSAEGHLTQCLNGILSTKRKELKDICPELLDGKIISGTQRIIFKDFTVPWDQLKKILIINIRVLKEKIKLGRTLNGVDKDSLFTDETVDSPCLPKKIKKGIKRKRVLDTPEDNRSMLPMKNHEIHTLVREALGEETLIPQQPSDSGGQNLFDIIDLPLEDLNFSLGSSWAAFFNISSNRADDIHEDHNYLTVQVDQAQLSQ